MRKNVLFIFCFGVFVMATGANAQTYQWVDDHCVVHLSDSPPPQGTNALVEIESDANFKPKPPTNLPSAHNAPNSESANAPIAAAEERTEPQNITVELYTASWCPYCKDARNFSVREEYLFLSMTLKKTRRLLAGKTNWMGEEAYPLQSSVIKKSPDFPQ